MKRGVLLSLLMGIGALSLTIAAQRGGPPPDQAPKVVQVDKISDNLYVLKGGGGNTAVFVMANGVTVVDTKLPGWGRPLLDKIKTVTNKPITTIVTRNVYFRPTRSPTRPNTSAPNGRTRKPAAYVAKAESSAAVAFPGGKNTAAKNGASTAYR